MRVLLLKEDRSLAAGADGGVALLLKRGHVVGSGEGAACLVIWRSRPRSYLAAFCSFHPCYPHGTDRFSSYVCCMKEGLYEPR